MMKDNSRRHHFTSLLKIFEKATKVLQTVKYPTMNLVVLFYEKNDVEVSL
jgi:hypothetical protein